MSFAKHFINDPVKLLAAALRSAPMLNPNVSVDEKNKIVYNDAPANSEKKVSIISGGGAGHEPAFVSLVGPGMLDAAVSGNVFASPSTAQIFAALRGVRKRNGYAEDHSIIMIIMNYTGDVLNFGMAAEKAKAAGIKVDMVVIGDDVGVGRKRGGKVGRRGIAGTVLMHKLAGALAEAGTKHDEVKTMIAHWAKHDLVSVGASLSHVHVPGREVSESTLGSKEIEIGMGIHNEQGSMTVEMPEFPELVKLLLKQLLDERDTDRAFLKKIHEERTFILMVNNLGGVSPLEMCGITAEVVEQLKKIYSIVPRRVYSGTFMTSLNGNGFSITLYRLPERPAEVLGFLDRETRTSGSPSSMHFGNWFKPEKPAVIDDSAEGSEAMSYVKSGLSMDVARFTELIKGGLENLIAAEQDITRYDELVGDGDCGVGLRRGAEAVLKLLESGTIGDDAVIAMQKVAEEIEKSMDGTSGALYCIYFNAFSHALRNNKEARVTSSPATTEDWYTAAFSAMKSLYKYTPAKPGDRTLMDALYPCLYALNESKGDIQAAAEAAQRGANSTRGMKAKLGRTVYVGNVGDVPDPGAVGVAKLIEGMANVLRPGR